MLALLIALQVGLVVPAHAQEDSDDAAWMLVMLSLVDPCRGVRTAAARAGFLLGGNPTAESIRHNAWAVMLPVLAKIATDDAVASDPTGILDFMAENVRQGASYPTSRAAQVLQVVEQAATEAQEAVRQGDDVLPGRVVLAYIFSDPDRRAAWRSVAGTGGLGGSRTGGSTGQVASARGRELTRCA
jgi:hypothetical protein